MVKIGKYSVKEWWARFRHWQVTPTKLETREAFEQHECINCGESFDGAFCPYCGQSAKTSRLTLRNALSNILDVWGLGTRSMPRALWHLLFRPGHMIADYLCGHRRPYFPPFKMLFVLTATALLLSHLLPDGEAPAQPSRPVAQAEVASPPSAADEEAVPVTPKESAEQPSMNETQRVTRIIYDMWNLAMEKIPASPAMLLLGWQFLFALSTGVFFRRSPHMGRVTFTEQFYAQVLIACQMQFLSILYMLITFSGTEGYQMNIPFRYMVAYALIDYKQLYGYGWWGTLWRSALTYALTGLFLMLLAFIVTIFVVLTM